MAPEDIYARQKLDELIEAGKFLRDNLDTPKKNEAAYKHGLALNEFYRAQMAAEIADQDRLRKG